MTTKNVTVKLEFAEGNGDNCCTFYLQSGKPGVVNGLAYPSMLAFAGALGRAINKFAESNTKAAMDSFDDLDDNK